MKEIYCKHCTGCGEDGCCSAVHCLQKEDGLYCETYLMELKFAYRMFRDTYAILEDHHKEELDEIYKNNYNLTYN